MKMKHKYHDEKEIIDIDPALEYESLYVGDEHAQS